MTHLAEELFFTMRMMLKVIVKDLYELGCMVKKVDSKTLGHKNSIPLEPYLNWVQARAQNLMMPYLAILPIIVEPIVKGDIPYTILHPDMPTSLEELQR